MVCSDTSAVHSIITIKQDEDKIIPVDSSKVFCVAGEAGDRVQFSDYIIANVKLYALRNATELSTKSVANYARGELANALRRVRRRVGMQPWHSRHDEGLASAARRQLWAGLGLKCVAVATWLTGCGCAGQRSEHRLHAHSFPRPPRLATLLRAPPHPSGTPSHPTTATCWWRATTRASAPPSTGSTTSRPCTRSTPAARATVSSWVLVMAPGFLPGCRPNAPASTAPADAAVSSVTPHTPSHAPPTQGPTSRCRCSTSCGTRT